MKTWRQDLHVIPLGGWALLCIITAFAIFDHRHGRGLPPFRILELLVGVAILIVAPTVFAIYLWRARSVWVKLDPAKGLVLPGGGLIAWESIRRVRRKRPRFDRKKMTVPRPPPREGQPPPREGIDGIVEMGLNLSGGISLAVFVITTAMTVVVTVTTLFLIPVLEVLTPFGERFTIETTSGRPLVLRDLRDADAFADELSRRVPVEG
jgi:hypothetical protein